VSVFPPPEACFPSVYGEEPPAPAPGEVQPELVTFVFPARGDRAGTCHMPWRKGCTVKAYLQAQPLRQHPILGMWKKCKAFNRNKQKVKLSYVPVAGDAIVVVRVRGRG